MGYRSCRDESLRSSGLEGWLGGGSMCRLYIGGWWDRRCLFYSIYWRVCAVLCNLNLKGNVDESASFSATSIYD